MLAGAHIIVGNAVAFGLTKNPALAFFIGLASHHLADFLPHLDGNLFSSFPRTSNEEFKSPNEWSFKLRVLVVAEFIIGMIIFLFLAKHLIVKYPLTILSATVGALFPDIFCILIPRRILNQFNLTKVYLNFHRNFHCLIKKGSLREILLFGTTEAIVLSLGFILLLLSPV